MIGLWSVCIASLGAEAIPLEQALLQARTAHPDILAAERQLAPAEARVLAAQGAWDPTWGASFNAGRTQSLQFQPPFPDPFRSVSTNWSVSTSFSGRTPFGTRLNVEGALTSFRSAIALADGSFEQAYFQPAFTLSASQDLLRGLRRDTNLAATRQAREAVTLAEHQAAAAVNTALAATARAWWTLWGAQRAVATAQEAVTAAEAAWRRGRALAEAGRMVPVDVLRLEAAMRSAEVSAMSARRQVADASDALLIAMGRAPGADVVADGVPTVGLQSHALDALLVDVASRHPEVAVAQARLEAARQVVLDARHNRLPTLTADVQGGVRGGTAEGWAAAFQTLGSFPTVGGGATFQMPLGNRVARAEIERAAAEVANAEADLAAVQARLGNAARAALRAYDDARARLALSGTQRALAEATLAYEVERERLGRIDTQTVIEARLAATRAIDAEAQAERDVALAEVELDTLTGALGRWTP
ncbi:MAG: Outer rane efflux protein [Pseudomonadota bacterium]|jgi:outer membrane protein TolC